MRDALLNKCQSRCGTMRHACMSVCVCVCQKSIIIIISLKSNFATPFINFTPSWQPLHEYSNMLSVMNLFGLNYRFSF